MIKFVLGYILIFDKNTFYMKKNKKDIPSETCAPLKILVTENKYNLPLQ